MKGYRLFKTRSKAAAMVAGWEGNWKAMIEELCLTPEDTEGTFMPDDGEAGTIELSRCKQIEPTVAKVVRFCGGSEPGRYCVDIVQVTALQVRGKLYVAEPDLERLLTM